MREPSVENGGWGCHRLNGTDLFREPDADTMRCSHRATSCFGSRRPVTDPEQILQIAVRGPDGIFSAQRFHRTNRGGWKPYRPSGSPGVFVAGEVARLGGADRRYQASFATDFAAAEHVIAWAARKDGTE